MKRFTDALCFNVGLTGNSVIVQSGHESSMYLAEIDQERTSEEGGELKVVVGAS
jgi:hypothetical protein